MLEQYISNQYIRAMAIFLALFVILRILLFIGDKIILILTKKTKTDFDAIDEANTRIYNALNKAKIEIPFPQMDIHLKESSKRKF